MTVRNQLPFVRILGFFLPGLLLGFLLPTVSWFLWCLITIVWVCSIGTLWLHQKSFFGLTAFSLFLFGHWRGVVILFIYFSNANVVIFLTTQLLFVVRLYYLTKLYFLKLKDEKEGPRLPNLGLWLVTFEGQFFIWFAKTLFLMWGALLRRWDLQPLDDAIWQILDVKFL